MSRSLAGATELPTGAGHVMRVLRVLPLAGLWLGCATEPATPRPASCARIADGALLPLESLHADDHGALTFALSARRLLVVRASCAGVALLPGCSLPGTYRYASGEPESIFEDAAATEFEAVEGSGSRLVEPPRPRLLRTGHATTEPDRDGRARLAGACAEATHVVRAILIRSTAASEDSDACRSPAGLPPPSCGHSVTLELAALTRDSPRSVTTTASH